MYDPKDPVLGRVREICLRLPEAIEFESHGRPNFRAGARTVFAVFGAGPEHPRALILRIDPEDEPALRSDSRFFVPPYYPDRLATDLDGATADWDELAELVEASYRLVASNRMLTALDAVADGRLGS
jgi:hypothetical protein